jgi:hypothetical protein
VVNNDFLQSPTERSGNITLTKGVYPIFVTFFQREGGSYLDVSYQGPGISKRLIPDSAFYTPSASATTLNLPAAPLAVTKFKASVKSPSVVALTWKDMANNETAYKIYRSLGDSLTLSYVSHYLLMPRPLLIRHYTPIHSIILRYILLG